MAKTIAERVDQHTHVPAAKLVPLPPFPDAIKIEITARCNYACSFCATKRTQRPVGNIDRRFLQRILHEAKGIGVKEIGLFLLGEPFLVKELPEYIRYAKEEAGIEYVFLTTNGSLCSPERLKAVIAAGLDSIKFSINAGSADRYREMHGVDRFDTVIANLKWLGEYKDTHQLALPRICVSAIHLPAFQDDLNQLRALVAPYTDEFYFLPLYNQAGHVGGVEYTRIVGNPGRLDNMVPSVPCWALFNAAKITWNGWLTACCFDHDERFEIVDLNQCSLLDAWQHPRFVELRKRHLGGDMRGSLCAECLGL